MNEAFVKAMEEYGREMAEAVAATAAATAATAQARADAVRFLGMGFSEDVVSRGTGLSLEEVCALKAELIH